MAVHRLKYLKVKLNELDKNYIGYIIYIKFEQTCVVEKFDSFFNIWKEMHEFFISRLPILLTMGPKSSCRICTTRLCCSKDMMPKMTNE